MIKGGGYIIVFLLMQHMLAAQTIPGILKFEEGKVFTIQMEIKTTIAQQAGEKAIDFNVEGTAAHSFKVLSTSGNMTTLQHKANALQFNFDGMGQHRSFDSRLEKDMAGPFGGTVKDILSRTYTMVVDQTGKVISIDPEKTGPLAIDDRFSIVFSMLKDVTDVAYPPKKGDASFFKVLPDKEISNGEHWIETGQRENGKYSSEYQVTGVSDSTISVDLKGTGNSNTRATMMGRETSTTMNSSNSGRIIIDKTTGIIREKRITTEANGITEAMGGTLPVSSRTTIIIQVKPE